MNQIKSCCESIARSGFGTLQIPDALLRSYRKILDGYSSVPAATKASFSFASDTDGLVLVRGRSLEPVRLLDNEMAVLAGSLLTELSDCSIPAAYHAVLTPQHPVARSSLIYFVNPSTEQRLMGFYRRQPINLNGVANARHTGFGNHPLQLA